MTPTKIDFDHEHARDKIAWLSEQWSQRIGQIAKEMGGKTDKWATMRALQMMRREQAEFYTAVWHYEAMLETPAVLPLQPLESTTTLVPYEPVAKRKRGRPSTGGRKPRQRRIIKDEEDPF